MAYLKVAENSLQPKELKEVDNRVEKSYGDDLAPIATSTLIDTSNIIEQVFDEADHITVVALW
jgi:hypothetical protein